jgi:hypothetical protein
MKIAKGVWYIVRLVAVLYFACAVLGLLSAPRTAICVSNSDGVLECRVW